MSSKVMEVRDWWKNFRQKRRKKTILNDFLNIWKNNVRFCSKITHLLIALVTRSSYCAKRLKRHHHLFRLTSGHPTALASTLSTTASGDMQSSVYTRSRWTMLPMLATETMSMRRLKTNGDAVSGPVSVQETSFWTLVVISTVACLLQAFYRGMAKHVTTVVFLLQ